MPSDFDKEMKRHEENNFSVGFEAADGGIIQRGKKFGMKSKIMTKRKEIQDMVSKNLNTFLNKHGIK